MDKQEKILEILEKAGASSEDSRNAVLVFHEGKLVEIAEAWWEHHTDYFLSGLVAVPYATAVELGYRIAKLESKELEEAQND